MYGQVRLQVCTCTKLLSLLIVVTMLNSCGSRDHVSVGVWDGQWEGKQVRIQIHPDGSYDQLRRSTETSEELSGRVEFVDDDRVMFHGSLNGESGVLIDESTLTISGQRFRRIEK